MRYNITKSTGSIDKTYPIWIIIEAKIISSIIGAICKRKRRPFTIYKNKK